jgi:hypothetical protein
MTNYEANSGRNRCKHTRLTHRLVPTLQIAEAASCLQATCSRYEHLSDYENTYALSQQNSATSYNGMHCLENVACDRKQPVDCGLHVHTRCETVRLLKII